MVHEARDTAFGQCRHLRFVTGIANCISIFLVKKTEIHMGATAAFIQEWFWQTGQNNAMFGSYFAGHEAEQKMIINRFHRIIIF